MLTVLLTTARVAKLFVHQPDWNQFELLGRCLDAQTYRDFELVVVSPFENEVREALAGRSFPSTVVPPRQTPWRKERMFTLASARNTGLTHARGDWVLTLDDGCEFSPDLLGRVAGWASQNCALAVLQPNDGRWGAFEKAIKHTRGARDSVQMNGTGLTPYGLVCFPIAAAVAINGYDELLFDGARGLEDINFGRRMMAHGVRFMMDRHVVVSLHATIGYPEEVIKNEDQNGRCCNTAFTLAKPGQANRERLTADEKQKVLNCMFWRDDGRCGYHGYRSTCAYPAWAKDGHPVARRILLNDEDELFDLAEARRAAGVS